MIEQSPNAANDVAKAISQHLMGDSVHNQKRALTVLEGIVEMGTPQFQKSFATPSLVSSLKSTSISFGTDNGVRRKLMLILLSWHRHFMRDPEMAHVSSLYGLCGGVDRQPLASINRTNTSSAPENRRAIDLLHVHGLSSVEGTIEAADKECENLLNAMAAASKSSEPIMQDPDVKTHATLTLELQKEIVHFIHTVGDSFYLSALVLANDKIVDVLQRLQDVAAGMPVSMHPLGTNAPSKEELIVNASRRLSVPDVMPTPSNALLREVDHSLMVHSGFTSAAPSRPSAEPSEQADPNEIDMSAVERNSQQVQGSISGIKLYSI